MKKKPRVSRIVANIYSNDLEKTTTFYTDFLGLNLVMDLGWVLTFASPENPAVQINFLRNENGKELRNEAIFLSVEVSDVDIMHQTALQKSIPIVYSLTDESWGVRRFFVHDPNGATINLLQHL